MKKLLKTHTRNPYERRKFLLEKSKREENSYYITLGEKKLSLENPKRDFIQTYEKKL